MTTVQAWQHIYSNVEKEQSPQGQGGFQTLFYSHSGLARPEIEEMEGRLLYFPSGAEPVKRLFFTLAGGKSVISQIVFLPDPDRYGRGGRYLAHSLVFSPEALAQFQANPFRVFSRFTFITTVAEALAQGEFQSGDIPPLSLDLPPQPVEAAAHWPGPEIKKLALLALRAPQQAQQRQAITFTGQPDQLLSALEVAFLAVPVALRPHCSFDTYFYRCNLVAASFWAIGLPEPPASIKFAQVDSARRQVQGSITTQPQTAYERWVLATIEQQKLAHLPTRRESAFALAQWLDGRPYDQADLEAAPPGLVAAVFEANPGPVQQALRQQAAQHLPPALTGRVGQHLFRRETPPTHLYRYLRQGFELPHLLDLLYQGYEAQQLQEPAHREIKALQKLLQQTDHPLLSLSLAYWTDPRHELPRQLALASPDDYRRFTATALPAADHPLDLLVPPHAETFLALYQPTQPAQTVALAQKLVEIDRPTHLAHLADSLPGLPPPALHQLADLVQSHPDVPPSFRAALEKALQALPPKKGLKKVLNSVWRRLPGR